MLHLNSLGSTVLCSASHIAQLSIPEREQGHKGAPHNPTLQS